MGLFDFGKKKEEEKKGKTIQLNNTAPNGMAVDITTLTEVPNADNSGTDWEIMFKEFDFLEAEHIGWANLTLARVQFVSGGHMSYGGLNLLAKWIEENKEDPA